MSMRNNFLHEEFYASSTKNTVSQMLDYSLNAKHNTTNVEVVNLTSIYK